MASNISLRGVLVSTPTAPADAVTQRDTRDRLLRLDPQGPAFSASIDKFQVAAGPGGQGAQVSARVLTWVGLDAIAVVRNKSLDTGSADLLETFLASTLRSGCLIAFSDQDVRLNTSVFHYWLKLIPKNKALQVRWVGPVSSVPSGLAAGTVTSVGLAAPPEFTVSGSPVTTAGVLTLTKTVEPANTVWAGPEFAGQTGKLIQQARIVACSGSGSALAVFQDAVTAGNLLLFLANYSGSPGAVTDTLGQTWLTAVSAAHTAIFYCIASTSGSETINFASSCASTGGYQVVAAYEISGIVSSSPLDRTGTANGTGPATVLSVSTSAAVTSATELVVGMFATDGNAIGFTEGSGSTQRQAYSANGQSTAHISLDATSGLSGVQTLSVTVPKLKGSDNWYGAIATFKTSGVSSGEALPTFRPLISEDIPVSVVLSGLPTAPTPPAGDSSTAIATTAFITSAAGLFRLIRVFWITSSQTYTPTAGARALYVEVWGAGGGGGSANATTSNASVGGGGGAGGYSASFLTSLSATYTVTIGAGGSGGTAGGAGGAGGATSFGSNPTANGGAGGSAGTAAGTAIAMAGASSSAAVGTGDIALAGQGGPATFVLSATSAIGFGVGGSVLFGSLAGFGGAVAAMHFAPATPAQPAYGSGGQSGGNIGTQAVAAGAPGAPGIVRVWEFA